MVFVGAVGLGIPKTNLPQETAKRLVANIFGHKQRRVSKLLPVFDNALIDERQLAASIDWYKKKQSLKNRNDLYIKETIRLSLEAIDACLTNGWSKAPMPYEAIDLIVFVSSTGIATPSIDSYLINERPFKEQIVRMPLWGLGCGGGAIGLSRAFEWLEKHQDKTALVVCTELCSLTFQQDDDSSSNIVGAALFGDGAACTLLVGETSPYVELLPKQKLSIMKRSSFLKKGTLDIMGWNVTNSGFEVIFSKKIPNLVQSIWNDHLQQFLQEASFKLEEIHSFLAHPGGRKVLEQMGKALPQDCDLLAHSYAVLKHHGNMSSATVLYVLKRYLEKMYEKEETPHKPYAVLSALGPGFCSELIAMRWNRT